MAFLKLKKIFDIDLIYWMVIIAVPTCFIGLLVTNSRNNYHTSTNHPNPNLRTRTYNLSDDEEEFCHTIENLIPKLSTYGLNWRLVYSNCNPVHGEPLIIKAEVPVLFFY